MKAEGRSSWMVIFWIRSSASFTIARVAEFEGSELNSIVTGWGQSVPLAGPWFPQAELDSGYGADP